MSANDESQADITPIAVDDITAFNGYLATANDTNKIQTVQYDQNKIASTCLGQFFKNYDVEKHSASCCLCNTAVKKSGDSTFNFIRHVKRHHPSAYNDWKKNLAAKQEQTNLKQTSIKIAMMSPRGTKYAHDHPRQISLAKMVTNDLIIGLALPLSIVERSEFLHAMATVDQMFIVPSRRKLARDVLPKLVGAVEAELKQICKASQFVSLTFDIWTDRRMRSFYAITVHLIDQCLFKSHLLAFKYISGMFFNFTCECDPLIFFCSGSHTGEKLLQAYEETTAQYGVESKVVRLITDNASNNLKAFGAIVVPGFESYFKECFDESESNCDSESDGSTEYEIDSDLIINFDDVPLGNEELLRLPCFIHTLQLVVSDGFKESGCIQAAVAKVSSIARFRYKTY